MAIPSPQAPQKQMATVCWPPQYRQRESEIPPIRWVVRMLSKQPKADSWETYCLGMIPNANLQGWSQADEVISHFPHTSSKTGWEKPVGDMKCAHQNAPLWQGRRFPPHLSCLTKTGAEPCSPVCPHTDLPGPLPEPETRPGPCCPSPREKSKVWWGFFFLYTVGSFMWKA